MILKSKNNYGISYEEVIPENPKIIIIAMHGFAGDKTSGCIEKLSNAVFPCGMGVIKFDWPSHGESEVDGNNLTIENCINDLKSVYQYISTKYSSAKIVAFATSFGGYLTLLYNSFFPKDFDSLILRAPAIKMYDVLTNNVMDKKMKEELKNQGYFYFGYERVMKVYEKFIEDLKNNNIVKIYENKTLSNVIVFHGTDDEIVPIEDSLEFVKKHSGKIYTIKNANHRFDKEGQVEEIIKITKQALIDKYKK